MPGKALPDQTGGKILDLAVQSFSETLIPLNVDETVALMNTTSVLRWGSQQKSQRYRGIIYPLEHFVETEPEAVIALNLDRQVAENKKAAI